MPKDSKINDLEMFRSLVENANVFMYRLSLDGKFTYVSPKFKKVYTDFEELLGQHFSVLVHSDDIERCNNFMLKVFETKKEQEGLRYRVQISDDYYEWHTTNASPLMDEDDNVSGFVGVAADIGAYISLENNLKKSRAKYLELVELSSDWIWEINLEGKYTYCSSHVMDILGYFPEEMIGHSPFEFMSSKEEVKRVYLEFQKILKKKKRFTSLENQNLTKSGKIICVLTSGVPIFNEKGDLTGYRGLDVNITNQKKAERAILQTARLSAVGELASAVAHDFNNALQGILGYSELALEQDMPADLREYFKLINKFSDDAAARIRQLQRFAGNTENSVEYQTVSINLILDDAIEQTKNLWKTEAERDGISIQIEKDFQESLFTLGLFTELRTVLFNVIKNAVQAMSSGGTLSFKTRKTSEDRVCICVSDTGMGMSQESRERIFEPFYSTNGSLGRGLGMAGAYSIIKEHKGEISVKSSSMKNGTVIEILLPCVEKSNLVKEEKTFAIISDLRILWVDDESTIRKLLKKAFKRIPCFLDLADGGIKALELLSKNKYDLLITDIGMPEMSGWQLLDKVKKKYPKLKLAIATGWGNSITVEKQKFYNLGCVLTKPFSMEDIRKLLLEISQLNGS